MGMHKSGGTQLRGVRKIAEEHNESAHFTHEPGTFDGACGVPTKGVGTPQHYEDQANAAEMVNKPSRSIKDPIGGGK